MPNSINILNKTFGELTVIEKVPSKNGKTYWKCACSCGRILEIQTYSLTGGRSKTCGHCLKNKGKETTCSILKKCEICGEEFKTIKFGKNRRFCFNCSPYRGESGSAKTITAIRKAIKKELVRYKGGGCEICGYNKCLEALQFHHIDPTTKDFTIATNLQLQRFDINIYYKEVDKCQLLCSNCHAEIHSKTLSSGSLPD